MNETEFIEHIKRGREQAGVEFKGPGKRTDKYFFAKVARAMLAMANRRDGGVVIVGVDEDHDKLVLTGVPKDQARTWTFDHVADKVHEYATPSIDFDLELLTHDSKTFVVISVREFDDVPVICAKSYNKDGNNVLQEGALYVRPRRKPESIAISTYPDMRDLVDLAVDKAVRRFVRRARGAGVVGDASEPRSDKEKFEAQERDFR